MVGGGNEDRPGVLMAVLHKESHLYGTTRAEEQGYDVALLDSDSRHPASGYNPSDTLTANWTVLTAASRSCHPLCDSSTGSVMNTGLRGYSTARRALWCEMGNSGVKHGVGACQRPSPPRSGKRCRSSTFLKDRRRCGLLQRCAPTEGSPQDTV